MSERIVRGAEFIAVAASVVVLVVVLVPWVRTGALDETDTVNGIEIPVLGWSTVITAVVAIAFAVAAVALRNRWLWCAHAFTAGLMVTGATIVLSTLDVLDSAVLGWVMKALPESVREVAPELRATFMLWFAYSMALAAVITGCLSAVGRSQEDRGDDSDDWMNDRRDDRAIAGSSVPAMYSPWATDEVKLQTPPWMEEG